MKLTPSMTLTPPPALGLLLPVLAALAAPPAHAAAPCSGSIVSGNLVSGKTAYDPYSARSVADSYGIVVTNTSASPCSFGLNFQTADAQLQLGKTLAFTMLDASGRQFNPDLIGARPTVQLVSPEVAPNASYTFNYQIGLERGQSASAGSYSSALTLNLYALHQGQIAGGALGSKTCQITYVTPQSLSVNLKGGALTTTLSFSPMNAGAQRQVFIEARANQPYAMRVSSDNGGAMVLSPAIAGQKWSVPYTAKLDGAVLDLRQQTSAAVQSSAIQIATAPRKDAEHCLTITIGDVANKRAGTYRDVITVEIAGAAP